MQQQQYNLDCLDDELFALIHNLAPQLSDAQIRTKLNNAKKAVCDKLIPIIRQNHSQSPVTQSYDTCKLLLQELAATNKVRRGIVGGGEARFASQKVLLQKYFLTPEDLVRVPEDLALYVMAIESTE